MTSQGIFKVNEILKNGTEISVMPTSFIFTDKTKLETRKYRTLGMRLSQV